MDNLKRRGRSHAVSSNVLNFRSPELCHWTAAGDLPPGALGLMDDYSSTYT